MKRKITVVTLYALLLALCPSAEAQQATKVPRIGHLIGTSPSAYAARTEAFRQGLRELGYLEGQNIAIEYRYAEGKQQDRYPEFLAELVRLKVDVIVTGSAGPTSFEKFMKQTRFFVPNVREKCASSALSTSLM